MRLRLRHKIIIIVFLISQMGLWLGVHCCLTGEKLALSSLEEQIGALEKETKVLEKEIAHYSSLSSVRKRSVELGLTRSSKVVILPLDESIALGD